MSLMRRRSLMMSMEEEEMAKEWKLINSITVSEEASSLCIDTDLDGNAFEVDEIAFTMVYPAYNVSNLNYYFSCRNATTKENNRPALKPTQNVAGAANGYHHRLFGGYAGIVVSTTTAAWFDKTGTQDKIKELLITVNTWTNSEFIIPIGTVINLYGR